MTKIMTKMFTKTTYMVLMFLFICSYQILAQVSISGTVKDSKSGEVFLGANILVKGKVIGTITGLDGTFSLNVSSNPPVTLVFSMVGFITQEMEITTAQANGLEINLEENIIVGKEIVVSASRIEETIMQSPVAIEKMDILTAREVATPDFYSALANFKGVDMSTQSLTFQTINTRGFGSNGNTRFVQLIDGIDNQAPGLNFSVGNVVGISDLDLESAELTLGTASALYGANALNGILLLNSKNPFDYQGLSVSAKLGVTHADQRDDDISMYRDFSLRYAKAFNNKFAFKLNGSFLQAKDFRAVDYRDRTNIETSPNDLAANRASNIAYDGVNVYGNISLPLISVADLAIAGGNTELAGVRTLISSDVISTRGYTESEMVNNDVESLKLNAALHYRIGDNIEAFVQGNYGSGSTVYTTNDRFILDNFSVWTLKAELKGSNFYLRGYTTQENSGDTYAANTLATRINLGDAVDYPNGYLGDYLNAFVISRTGQNPVSEAQAHINARAHANSQQPLPGSTEFEALSAKIRSLPISSNGAKLLDKSNLFHYEGLYNFTEILNDRIELLAGANYRVYNLNTENTLFALDNNGNEISYGEIGGFVQASKSFLDKKLKLSASLRYDKNENFAGQFAPRASAVFSPKHDQNIRISYQRGYRNPTVQDQYIDLDVTIRRLIGSNPLLIDRYNFKTNPVYTVQDIEDVKNGIKSPDQISPVVFKDFKTEKIRTFEVGYKGLIFDKLYFDAYYYYSSYTDFIAEIQIVQATPMSGAPTDGSQTPQNPLIPNSNTADLKSEIITRNPMSTQEFGVNINANGNITSQGWAAGLEYSLGGGYNLGGNVSYNDLISQQDLLDQGFRASYNTPNWRVNTSFKNREVFGNLGFNIAYKWQEAFLWESAYGLGVIPSFTTVDAQVSYKIPDLKTIVKLGGTNIFNERYTTSFGNPSIGSLYYVSLTFDEFFN